ncbi:disulfide bond formation protein B [Endozoicomonas sp. 8E]|uniref:disulfide bond formation protein B n=1 Tax=Endozoicomonas sp. 8E TaxID=3035692 RepID=UPI0029391DBE|nr:disulfide bond formation protein B [Endozoicomonas sp. 8E]WOG27547.1 disulfide bond formation protein B [Endozoicomonas sp. 8E]
MNSRSEINDLVKFASVFELTAICLLLVVAFWFQFVMGELPCPLCILQRQGILIIASGFLLNMRYHIRPGHYSLSLLAAVLTSFISLRQIALHVTTPQGYGSAFLGLHMYTWLYILCSALIVYIALVVGYSRQFELHAYKDEVSEARDPRIRGFSHLAFAFLVFLIVANIVSVFFECGLEQCPDNPMRYMVYGWL